MDDKALVVVEKVHETKAEALWLREELEALKDALAKNKKGDAEIKKIRYCVRKIEYMLDRWENKKCR